MQNDIEQYDPPTGTAEPFIDNGTYVGAFFIAATVAILSSANAFLVVVAVVGFIAVRKGAVGYSTALVQKATPRITATAGRISGYIEAKQGIKEPVAIAPHVAPFLPADYTCPIGNDRTTGAPVVIDFMTSYHIGIFGGSGCGKDNLIRHMFLHMAQRNSPDSLQFVFLDGKGEWIIPQIASLAHMWLPPAGGYGKSGDEAMLEAIKRIDEEAERRSHLFTDAGCTSREEYMDATGETIPLLFVILSDVMGTVEGGLEALLTHLVSKARSLGIRVVVSMQTPTGKAMQWRSNLSINIAAPMGAPSQDEPAMGCKVTDLIVRPSELEDQPGLFVFRKKREQHVIVVPLVAKAYAERIYKELPVKGLLAKSRVTPQVTAQVANHKTKVTGMSCNSPCNSGFNSRVASPQSQIQKVTEEKLLADLLAQNGENTPKNPADEEDVTRYNAADDDDALGDDTPYTFALSASQADYIAQRYQTHTATAITKGMPGYNPRLFRQQKEAVTRVIETMKGNTSGEL